MSSPSDAEVIGHSLGEPEAFGLICIRKVRNDRMVTHSGPFPAGSQAAAALAASENALYVSFDLFRVHWPGMPHDMVTRAMRLLAEKVFPLVA